MTVTIAWPGDLGKATFDGETWVSSGPISAETLNGFVPKMSVMMSDWEDRHAKDVAQAVGAELVDDPPNDPTMLDDLIMPDDEDVS